MKAVKVIKVISISLMLFSVSGCGLLRGPVSKPSQSSPSESSSSTTSNHSSASSRASSDESSENAETTTDPGAQLRPRFRIVGPSSTDPSIPDAEGNLDEETPLERSTFDQDRNTLIFHEPIRLPDPSSTHPARRPEKFLVWFSSLVQTATVTHRVIRQNGERIAVSVPTSAWPSQNGWYIPIGRLFRNLPNYSITDVDPTDLQILEIVFTQTGGPNLLYNIHFHAIPALPQLALQSESLRLPQNPEHFGVGFGTHGLAVLEETLNNPSGLPLKLWARITPGHTIQLSTLLSPYINKPLPRCLKVNGISYLSVAPLQITHLNIRHSDDRIETLELPSNSFASFTVPPSDTVHLSWIARPAPGTPQCQLPEPIRPSIDENEMAKLGLHAAHLRNKKQLNPFKTPFRISAAEVQGQWEREIRISHDFVPQDLALDESSLDSFVLTQGQVRVSEQNSPGYWFFRALATPLSCQGVFTRGH